MSRKTVLEALGRIQTFYPYVDTKEQVKNLDNAGLVPIYCKIDDEYKQIPQQHAVLNRGTWRASAIVSKHYQIAQHSEVFDKIIDSFERVGVADASYRIENDRDIARLHGIFPEYKIHDDTSGGLIPGFQFKNGYDGATAISGSFYGIRNVCLNGLISKHIISDAKIKISHMSTVSELDDEIHKFTDGILSGIEHLHDCIRESMQVYLIYEDYEEFEVDLVKIVSSKKIARKIMGELPLSMSKYDLFNSITQFASHADIKHVQRDKILANAEIILMEGI